MLSIQLRSVCLALWLALTLVACDTAGTEPVQSLRGISVEITSSTCPSITIKAGDQVLWTNNDRVEHIVQVEDLNGRSLVESGNLQPGDSFGFVFPEAGSYVYRCSAGGDTTGTITVEP